MLCLKQLVLFDQISILYFQLVHLLSQPTFIFSIEVALHYHNWILPLPRLAYFYLTSIVFAKLYVSHLLILLDDLFARIAQRTNIFSILN